MAATTITRQRAPNEMLAVRPRLATEARAVASDRTAARYRAPSPRDGLVARTELLSRLAVAREYPLLLVTAPAGYGKTTLLSQWSERADRPVAWVALEEPDSDPARLARSVAAALESIGIDSARPARCCALVFDNAQVVRPGTLANRVLDLLGLLPRGSQLALASRCEPTLPLGRMRGHRMLVELGAEDLSMSAVEAGSMLRKAGINLEFTAVQELVRRTEGWPAALELAVNSVAAGRNGTAPLELIAGDDHQMAEYLRAEFLASFPAATRRFLTRSSVLDRLSGPLCDAVLQRTRSASMLARLQRENVPLVAVDPSHEWYRVHGLLREMLQTELRRTEPGAQSSLHRRAGDWHSGAGDVDRAIDHARSAGDVDLVGEMLWAKLPQYLGQGRKEAIQRWLDGITFEHAARCPPLALAAAHSELAMGHIAPAEQWARTATAALSAASPTDADAQRAGILMVEAWAARSGTARMRADAAHAYDLLPDDSPWRASCCYLRGTSALLVRDDREAERQFDEGAVRGVSVSPDPASLCLAQLALLALERGDAESADDLAHRARNLIEEFGLTGYPLLALVFAVSGATDVGKGRVDEAKAAAYQCTKLIGNPGDLPPWYGAETRILLARVLLALGDGAGAREQLADASRLARRTAGVRVFERWFDDAWDRFDKRAETALIGMSSLTKAELRVLRFLPTHLSFHEIAERLNVSSNTVKTHVHAVYRKLDSSSRSEAVSKATRAGLLVT